MGKYKVVFPNEAVEKKFKKELSKIPKNLLRLIYREINSLSINPKPYGKKFKFLKVPVWVYRFTSQYRLRIGQYRILYDIDDENKIVWLLTIRKRRESTYK